MKDKQFRLGISPLAQETLTRMTETANDGFLGGQVDKSQLASWILIHFEKQIERSLGAIRTDHFNEVAFLKAVLEKKEKAVREGAACPEFDAISEKLTSRPFTSCRNRKPKMTGRADD